MFRPDEGGLLPEVSSSRDNAESSVTTGSSVVLPPRPGESELWAWLESLASDSERVRREDARFDLFDQWMDIYYGKHWGHSTPSYKPPIVINELRTLILSEASDLSDAELRIYVMKDPRTGGRDLDAERALRAVWIREQINLRLAYATCWALICGTGFLRASWDPDAFNGMGDVVVDDLDPRNVLPDPDAVDDRRWQYVIVEHVLDLSEIRRLFPVEGMRVRPEERWSVREGSSRSSSAESGTISWAQYEGPLANDSLLGRRIPGYKKARARVLDCLVRDDTVETVYEQTGVDEAGNPIMAPRVRAKYPNGRRIVGANGVILFDGPNPNPRGNFGIFRVVLEPALGRFWGTGFVQQTAELQLAADKMMSALVENAIRLNNGIVVAVGETGVDWESFAAIPGQIVAINPGSDFQIRYPPPMPPDMVQAPWRMLDMQRRLLGFPDPRVGMAGRGNISPELTETEISQAQGPTRLRARMLYYVVQRLAEHIFSLMAYNYTTPRVIPSVEGEHFAPAMWRPIENPNDYHVYVDPASLQIMSRTMLRRLGLALFRLRAIDRRSLLETLGWPDGEQVAGRMDQAEAAAAQAKLLAKGKS